MTLGVEATDDEKRDAVARIVASGALGQQSKLPAILSYLVEQELAGKGEALKGYAIATDVLGRGTDFDPGTDSIVRVELRRLRQALALYYATDGAADPVRVTIPSGTYRPSFERREGASPPDVNGEAPPPAKPAAETPGVELWGNIYNVQWETALGLQDDLAQRLLTDLRGQVLTASRRLSQKISRSKAATSVWQSYIQATWVPSNQPLSLAWEKERIALAEKAITDDPRFGPAHAILAQKLAMLELVSAEYRTPAMRERAAMHALKAMELGGDDPDAMFHVAVYDWSVGRLNDAEAAFRRVLELEPSHFLAGALAPAISLGCQVAPDSAIAALEERDHRLTPDNPYRWVLLSFIGTLQANAGHWDKAEAALRTAYFQHVGPETFIPLAAVLGQRGDSLEAAVHMRMQAANWPGIDMDIIASEFMTKRCSGKELPLNEAFLGLAKLLKSSPL